MKYIAVEKGLRTVTDYLNAQGYNVEEIDPRQRISKDFIDGFDVVVISGMDKDRMGDETTVAKTSIIDASGLTPKDIKDEIERRLQ